MSYSLAFQQNNQIASEQVYNVILNKTMLLQHNLESTLTMCIPTTANN